MNFSHYPKITLVWLLKLRSILYSTVIPLVKVFPKPIAERGVWSGSTLLTEIQVLLQIKQMHLAPLKCQMWGWTGIPQPPLPSPLTTTSFPLTPTSLPSSCASLPLVPHFLPLRLFLPPPSKINKQQFITSYNLSFQCMDYYQSFKTVGRFVCLFVPPFIC